MKRHSLTLKLLLYFGLTLIFFTVILGLSFALLFQQQLQQLHRQELIQRAQVISQTLGEYWDEATTSSDTRPSTSKGGIHALEVAGQSLNTYLKVIDQVALSDIWVIDQEGQLVTSEKESQPLADQQLPEASSAIINQAFAGQTIVSDTFTSPEITPAITVAAPVLTADDEIVAVILLHTTISSYQSALNESFPILGISLGLAFLITFLFAVFFTKRFVSPIRKMKLDVEKLARGDYNIAVSGRTRDEISELSATLVALAKQLQAAETEQQRFQTMRQAFMTNISHELRTPVTVIRGSLELLHDGIIQDETQRQKYYRQMLHESIQLEHLLNDLLELSKLQTPEFQITKQPIQLNELLARVARSVMPLMEQKQQQFTLNLAFPPTIVSADEQRLEQFFKVFLTNAQKFCPPGAEISLSGEQQAHEQIEIRIQDNGPGIDEGLLPHIFERFSKNQLATNEQGSGLGLAIAQELAQRHGIQLRVQSKIGQGTTFFCLIPTISVQQD